MKTKQLLQLGVPFGEAQRRAIDFISSYLLKGGNKTRLAEEIQAVVANPSAFAEDPLRKEFANALVHAAPAPRAQPAAWD